LLLFLTIHARTFLRWLVYQRNGETAMSATATLCSTLSIARFGMLSKLHALWLCLTSPLPRATIRFDLLLRMAYERV
jgi:hypothetical protein